MLKFNRFMLGIKQKIKSRESKGFTLVEVMVSAAIIIVIASVVVYNHQKFDNNLELSNVSYRIASAIREAQVYGISSSGSSTSESFRTSYGIHIGLDGSDNFILFNDISNNGKYRESGLSSLEYVDCVPVTTSGGECLEKVSFGRGIFIESVAKLSGGVWTTYTSSSGDIFLDILFKRPNPDATINIYDGYQSGSSCGISCNTVAVCLSSSQGEKRQVVVSSAGQISVENVDSGDNYACD